MKTVDMIESAEALRYRIIQLFYHVWIVDPTPCVKLLRLSQMLQKPATIDVTYAKGPSIHHESLPRHAIKVSLFVFFKL